MMGGADNVLEKAHEEFEAASDMSTTDGRDTYRWLAELLNHVVFAEPGNDNAKQLLARVYDQLGYQAESAPWRDFYLTGAYELRHGSPEEGILRLTRPLFVDLLIGRAGLKELLFSDEISFEGSRLDLIGFFSMLDKPQGRFNIVTP